MLNFATRTITTVLNIDLPLDEFVYKDIHSYCGYHRLDVPTYIAALIVDAHNVNKFGAVPAVFQSKIQQQTGGTDVAATPPDAASKPCAKPEALAACQEDAAGDDLPIAQQPENKPKRRRKTIPAK